MLFASKLAVVRPLMLSLVVCSQLGAARAQANSPFTRAHNQGNELISLIHDAASTTAIVHYMERSDQTLASRRDLLQSVRVARSHNREIGRNVAAYAETSDEGLNVDAIETLGAMGTAVVSDHRQWLTDVAADDERGSAMRSAAKNVLASVP